MRVVASLLLWCLLNCPAAAHGPHGLAPENVWNAWTFDPLVIVPIVIATWLYTHGARRLWENARRQRGRTALNALAFSLGVAALFVALVSPLDALGETLLAAHMTQHGLLVAIAPPLLLLGRPGVVLAWSLPDRWRKRFLVSALWRGLTRIGQFLSRPLQAALLHGVALWLWHSPAAFEAALESYPLHAFEHVSFFGSALLFWQACIATRSTGRIGAALAAAFTTLLHSGLLGALLSLAPYPLYPWNSEHTELWGLSHIQDQQLAGLLMWVPMGTVYLAACLVLAGRLVAAGDYPASGEPSPRPGPLMGDL